MVPRFRGAQDGLFRAAGDERATAYVSGLATTCRAGVSSAQVLMAFPFDRNAGIAPDRPLNSVLVPGD